MTDMMNVVSPRNSIYLRIKRVIDLIGVGSGIIGIATLVFMMLLTVSDVILRRIFNSPLTFSFELTNMLLAVAALLLAAYSVSKMRQVSIDLIVAKLPPKPKRAILAAGDFIGFGLLGVVSWQCVLSALQTKEIGYVTGILKLPVYAFILVVAFGAAMASLALLIRFIENFRRSEAK
jgi:TRAP-type C4-dicarboxylate transport system permease small subunit